ncbi:MAG: excinuclease ABC subunit UvrA, partial [Coxiellaceae bacterium]|nr:excinuclease ABC subunit UvrA [Coxiellaceae bacterium]
PAIAIEQKSASHNPRSTVGTITEIYDYLRLLYARVGNPRCPTHGNDLEAQTVSQMVDVVMALPEDAAVMILSPVVRARKGEHEKVFDRLRNEGFVRVRVNGTVYELDEAPKLNLRQKHTIEAVVDRLKVRKEAQQRIAESFETALRLSDGLATLASMNNESEDRVFSAKFACPECGYSLEELEPRLFSFNSPVGACSTCDGLGRQEYFDAEKVVHNSALSLAGGAIRGWDRNNYYYFQLLQSIAKHYDFDIETPWNQLPKTIHSVILYGSGDEEIAFQYTGPSNKATQKKHPFEGVLPNMERLYDDTESMAVREELSKYLSESHCEAFDCTRLCLEARHVFISKKSLPDVTQLSVEKALEFFSNIKLTGKRGEIAEKILKE